MLGFLFGKKPKNVLPVPDTERYGMTPIPTGGANAFFFKDLHNIPEATQGSSPPKRFRFDGTPIFVPDIIPITQTQGTGFTVQQIQAAQKFVPVEFES